MYETDIWSGSSYGLKAESYQRAEMPAQVRKRDTEAGKIGCVEGTFLGTSSNGDNAAERRGMLQQWKEVGDEAEAGVIVQ